MKPLEEPTEATRQSAGSETVGRMNVASSADCVRCFLTIVLPTWVQGIFRRRPMATALVGRGKLDFKSIQLLRRLRRKYGDGPLVIRGPFKSYALLLSARDAAHVLQNAPQPFSPASREKRTALSHFEPETSLITKGMNREFRRAFHDAALESHHAIHSLAPEFLEKISDVAARLAAEMRSGVQLTWPVFSEAWFNAVRWIVLGEHARHDELLSQMLTRLRSHANWVYFPGSERGLRSRYHARLQGYLDNTAPDSLVALLARERSWMEAAPTHQITQWLFAFDAGGITTFRALALLASHPERTMPDIDRFRAGETELPFLRACFLETVRLWPTTPLILRETTERLSGGKRVLPKGTGIAIYTPFFDRDTDYSADAELFHPPRWTDKDPVGPPPFFHFSAGPAACPGRQVVTLIGSLWLAALFQSGIELLNPAPLDINLPMPAAFNHFVIRFAVATPPPVAGE
jgi:cytochrome P450